MKEQQKVVVKRGGISFLSLLTLAFIILKLSDIITWSWFWVLSPIWIPAAIVVCVYIIFWLICITAISRK